MNGTIINLPILEMILEPVFSNYIGPEVYSFRYRQFLNTSINITEFIHYTPNVIRFTVTIFGVGQPPQHLEFNLAFKDYEDIKTAVKMGLDKHLAVIPKNEL